MKLRLPRLRPLPRRARKLVAACLACCLLAALWLASGGERRQTWPRGDILSALRWVESHHNDNVRDGDGGKAIGPYQIHLVYWQDAQRAEAALGNDYQRCRDRAYAEAVIAAYMQKWAAAAWATGDAETIARVHNGGPLGASRDSTLPYWQRVRAQLP